MSLSADRGWMYDVGDADRFLSDIFCSNLDVFLDFAFSDKAFVDNNRIKCPCLECDNKHFKTRNDVMFHLYEKGFTPNYTTWFAHGETTSTSRHEGESHDLMEDVKDVDECKRMVVKVCPTNGNDTTYEPNCNSNVLEGTKGYQKNLKVKLNSELFKCKSRSKIVNLTQPQNNTGMIMKKHDALNNLRVSTIDHGLSIFRIPGERLFLDGSWRLADEWRDIVHPYILFNCAEVKPFIRLFDDLTRQQQPNIDGGGRDMYRKLFAEWFEKLVSNCSYYLFNYYQGSDAISEDLKAIAGPPVKSFGRCEGYSINGYKFHTKKRSEKLRNKLSGVCVRATVYNEYEHDYYGVLDDIVEITYNSKYGFRKCVLFKCEWFDTPGGVGVKRKNDLVHIDSKVKLLTSSPFVLPSYTEQVFYAPHRSMSNELKDWWDSIKS